MGLGTDHRLPLAQNPVLLAGQIAILLASCNRDVSRLCKRRQVAGREEVRAGDSESRAQFGRTPRAVRQPLQDVVRHLGTALSQKPSCFVMLLIIDQTSLPQRADHFDPKTSPLYPKDPMSLHQRPYVSTSETYYKENSINPPQPAKRSIKVNFFSAFFFPIFISLSLLLKKIHLSCALPSGAFPFLRPKFCSLKFRVKPSDFPKILKRKEKQGI